MVILRRMSAAAEVKPIEVIKFDEFNNDGRVDGLLSSGVNFSAVPGSSPDGEKNVYIGVPVDYKDTVNYKKGEYKPAGFMGKESDKGSKSITPTKAKYKFFVRKFGDVVGFAFEQLQMAAFPFPDKTVNRHVWVILNAKNITDAKTAFIEYVSTLDLDDEATKSSHTKSNFNHPAVRSAKANQALADSGQYFKNFSFEFGGGRPRTTRRKYKKSVKSAKRVKSTKRSFSASRKYRNRK